MTTRTQPSIARTRPRQAVEVRTDAYWRSHGRGPRGRGSWLFRMEDAAGQMIPIDDPICREFFRHLGTYRESRKAAKAEARRLGARRIIVLP